LTELANNMAGGSRVGDAMTEISPTPLGATLKLRVAEARVEDIGRAVARIAPGDLRRIGARAGDVVKISGSATAVGRAELSDDGHEGMIQTDGTCRSNCGAGLQEQVTVSRTERSDFLAVVESDRGSPKQFKNRNMLDNSAGDLCPDAAD
jgi:hypothetical protein